MIRTAQDIVLAPIISEKSMGAIGQKKYSFRVEKTAGKIEIARAVEKLFGVKVKKVNTMNVHGHFRRQGIHGGYTSNWKKAIVTLTDDSKGIAFFESMT